MHIYSVTEARAVLGELLNKVTYQKQVIVLGRSGRAEALLVAYTPDDEAPMTELNAASESFSFLDEEPDLYSRDDLKKQYV